MSKFKLEKYIPYLEKLWIAEISPKVKIKVCPLPKKIYTILYKEKLIQRDHYNFKDRFGSCRIEGWILTDAGRFAYCNWCEKNCDFE